MAGVNDADTEGEGLDTSPAAIRGEAQLVLPIPTQWSDSRSIRQFNFLRWKLLNLYDAHTYLITYLFK